MIVVTEQPVTLTAELPGRTSPYETSDVRPQVDGIIRARLFTEGDYVRAGQPLYRIDPVTYEARVANARAALARARASTIAAEGQVTALCRACSSATSSRASSTTTPSLPPARRAPTSQAQARRAALGRRSTLPARPIRAPISGRIGRSLSTTGALVNRRRRRIR